MNFWGMDMGRWRWEMESIYYTNTNLVAEFNVKRIIIDGVWLEMNE